MRLNPCPLAPFSLINERPVLTTEVAKRIGGLYVANTKADPSPNSTRDPKPCPHCGGPVEWAVTATTKPEDKTPDNPTGIKRYVYARCTLSPTAHRWAFKNVDPSKPAPVITPKPSPAFVPPPKFPEIPTMPTTPADPSNPFAVFEAWIEAKVGGRLTDAEAKIAALKPSEGLSEAQIRTMIEEIAGKVSKKIEIVTPLATLKVNGVHHPILDEMLERYALGQRSFLLVGPAGASKTTIALQFARAIGAQRHSVIAMSEQAREETIRGYRNAMTDKYVPSAIVEDLCESLTGPTVSTLEEIDGSNPNTLLLVNTLENGFLSTPDADFPECHRGPDHVLIATANTFGHASSNVYVGRNQLDAATLNRFATLFVDYDPDLENVIVGDPEIATLGREIRKAASAASIRKVWSTRDSVRLRFDTRLSKNKGKARIDVARNYLTNAGWTTQEIGRVLP